MKESTATTTRSYHVINILRELKQEGLDLSCRNEDGSIDIATLFKKWYSILSGEKEPEAITEEMLLKIIDTLVYDEPSQRKRKRLKEIKKEIINNLKTDGGNNDFDYTLLKLFSQKIQKIFDDDRNLLFPDLDNIDFIFTVAENKNDLFKILHEHLDNLPTLLKIRFINKLRIYMQHMFGTISSKKIKSIKRRIYDAIDTLKRKVSTRERWFDELGDLLDNYYMLQAEISKIKTKKETVTAKSMDIVLAETLKLFYCPRKSDVNC